MGNNRCIEFTGLRLLGQVACVYYRGPKPIKKTLRRYGVQDVCQKVHYPAPHFCQVLVPSGEIVGEVLFDLWPERYLLQWSTPETPDMPTPEMALSAMWLHGPTPLHIPGIYAPRLDFYFTEAQTSPTDYVFNGMSSYVLYIMPSSKLNPAWAVDNEVEFFIRFTAPTVADCPPWVRMHFREFSVPLSGGEYEMQVDKASFYEDDVSYEFRLLPYDFSYLQFLELPDLLEVGKRGILKNLLPYFQFRIIARKKTDKFKLCWPKSVLLKHSVVALTDIVTGDVIGPPIKIMED